MLENDGSLGVLDELAVIRGAFGGGMSAEAAGRRADDQLRELRTALARMETSLQDLAHFPDADADFHFLVMALSGNQLASSVTRMLFQRAWQMAKFSANQSSEAHELTPSEHRRVYEAIAAGDAEAAEAAMKAHTIDPWHRRRLATQRDR